MQHDKSVSIVISLIYERIVWKTSYKYSWNNKLVEAEVF